MTQNNPPPQPPTRHQFTVQVNRQAEGHATYTLLQDDQPVAGYNGIAGGWDDTTPVPNSTYAATFHGDYFGHSSWTLDPAFSPARSGILLHTDFDNHTSQTSVGCLVA